MARVPKHLGRPAKRSGLPRHVCLLCAICRQGKHIGGATLTVGRRLAVNGYVRSDGDAEMTTLIGQFEDEHQRRVIAAMRQEDRGHHPQGLRRLLRVQASFGQDRAQVPVE